MTRFPFDATNEEILDWLSTLWESNGIVQCGDSTDFLIEEMKRQNKLVEFATLMRIAYDAGVEDGAKRVR